MIDIKLWIRVTEEDLHKQTDMIDNKDRIKRLKWKWKDHISKINNN